MARERHDAAFMVGALLGGVAGGVYGLFWAPQAGVRTRADLASRWGEATAQARQTVGGAEEQLRTALRRDAATPQPRPPLATPVVGASGPFTEADGEPVLLLPDPLEADPVTIIGSEPQTDAAAPGLIADEPTEPFGGAPGRPA